MNSSSDGDGWKWLLGFVALLVVCYLIGQSHDGAGSGRPDCYASAPDAATGGC